MQPRTRPAPLLRHLHRTAAVLLTLGACAAPRVTIAPAAPAAPAPGSVVYDTRLEVDTAAASLRAMSTLRFVADTAPSPQVALLLNRGLAVEEVHGPGVRSHTIAPFDDVPAWNLVTVTFDAVAPGSVITMHIAYSGQPELPSDGINGISSRWVELSLDSQWHPILASFDREMTGTLRLNLPRGWRVAASGTVTYEDGWHVVRNTVPQIDVAFAAAPLLTVTTLGAMSVHHTGDADAPAVLRAATACARYLDERFGARDPLPPGRIVLAPREGPGYARKNYIVLSRVSPTDSAGLHGYLCHELAHYWTTSAGPFTPDHWMTEAFAEYASARFLRERFGSEAFDRKLAQWEAGGRRAGAVWTDTSTARASGPAMYRRAPYLLARLEERIGMAPFDQLLEYYMVERVRTTPALLARLREVAGAEAEAWFRAELARVD